MNSPRQGEVMNQMWSLYTESSQEQQEIGQQLKIGVQQNSTQETRQQTKLKAHPSTQ